MKPVRLEFAGLQSYRELQVIDFTELLGGGLFGIFGPTGAGKSTILDAITLALYGRVGRAERGTFGIMNQGENRLLVKFTFSLGTEGHYRVERSYKREKGSESIRSEHARLVEIVGGLERVLADKERDVNDQVAGILGLTLDDFTRAVVLPQGQFAEFLHLNGRERTQMLQRIFDLSQYGEKLGQRLKQRVDTVSSQLDRVQGEQAGLGDASAETIAAAERELATADAAVTAAEQELAALEEEFRSWEKVWEQQQELDGVATALAGWQQRTTEADGWRAELDAAWRAELVRPHLSLAEESLASARAAEQRLASSVTSLEREREAETLAVAAHEGARARRTQDGPALTQRLHQLEQAVELEATLTEGRRRLGDLTERVAKGERLTREAGERITAAEAQVEQLAREEEELRRRLGEATVDPAHRERVAEARRLLDRLREADQLLAEANRRHQARLNQVAEAQRAAAGAQAELERAQAAQAAHGVELEQHQTAPPATEEELLREESWLSRAEEQIRAVTEAAALAARRQEERSAREAEAARLITTAETAAIEESRLRTLTEAARTGLEKARAQVEEARRHEHALALIRALTPGDPCPVCGSREHPSPATPAGDVELAPAQAALQAAEGAMRQAEQALEAAVRRRADAEGRAGTARTLLADSLEGLAEARAALASARDRLPQSWGGLAPAELPAALERQAAEQVERRGRYRAWQSQGALLRERHDERARNVGAASAALSAREATLAALELSRQESEREAAEQSALLAGRQAEFDAARGEWEAEAVLAEQERIGRADQEQGRLRTALDKLRQTQQGLEQRLAEDRRKQQEYTQLLHQRQLEQAQAQQTVAEADGRWQRLTEGQAAGPQLAQVQERIAQLEQAESEAGARREQAQRERGRAEAEEAAARAQRDLGGERAAQAAAALAEALSAAAFPDAGGARAALRSPERQAELEGVIGEFEREGDRLQSRQAALLALLDGRTLDAGQWQGWQDRRAGARSGAALRRDERSRAQQVRDDLLLKQKRWQELEEQRAALTSSSHHLEELKALLRGNAFVDFLAGEQMTRVAAEASSRLGQLTRQRYGLEIEQGGGFIVRDDGNGGTRRAVTTLSGGETFLTSLSLALALSAQIQLRGHYPLEFFFLDEGFGTLDPELLDVVITTLERLHFENLHVGIISHVPELRSRLQRRVIVESAEPGGRGSRLRLERA